MRPPVTENAVVGHMRPAGLKLDHTDLNGRIVSVSQKHLYLSPHIPQAWTRPVVFEDVQRTLKKQICHVDTHARDTRQLSSTDPASFTRELVLASTCGQSRNCETQALTSRCARSCETLLSDRAARS